MDTISISQNVANKITNPYCRDLLRTSPKPSNNCKQTLFVEEITFLLRPNVEKIILLLIAYNTRTCIFQKTKQ